MIYELYNLIIDLTEAGCTVEFKPFFSERPYPPEFIIVVIKTEDRKTSRHFRPRDLLEEDGQSALITGMIDMAKRLIRQSEIKEEQEAQEAQP